MLSTAELVYLGALLPVLLYAAFGDPPARPLRRLHDQPRPWEVCRCKLCRARRWWRRYRHRRPWSWQRPAQAPYSRRRRGR